nr:MAG TPA: hypothetical protein [Caudoviricetes sp.]
MRIFQCHCVSELPNTRTTFGVKYNGTKENALEIIDWIKSYRRVRTKLTTIGDELVIQFEDQGIDYMIGRDDYLLYTPKNIFMDCSERLFRNNFQVAP